MKNKLALVVFSLTAFASHLLFASTSKNCGCECCVGKEVCCCYADDSTEAKSHAPQTEAEKPVGHPLKGVVVDIMKEQQALLVKHEEIPGVMRAMTMMLRVEESALANARKNASVTGLLVRRGSTWWLDDVKFGEN